LKLTSLGGARRACDAPTERSADVGKISRVLYLLTFVLGASMSALAAMTPAERALVKALQARYSDMKAAMDARDAKTIASMLAPGFVSENVEGKTETADAMIREVAALPHDPKRLSDTMIEAAFVSGDTATVTQRYHMTTTKVAPDGATPKSIELSTASTDTWISSGNTWLLKQTVTMRLDYSIDGHVVAHKEHPGPSPGTLKQ
jgi:ketosteroid isomerase-like protein